MMKSGTNYVVVADGLALIGDVHHFSSAFNLEMQTIQDGLEMGSLDKERRIVEVRAVGVPTSDARMWLVVFSYLLSDYCYDVYPTHKQLSSLIECFESLQFHLDLEAQTSSKEVGSEARKLWEKIQNISEEITKE